MPNLFASPCFKKTLFLLSTFLLFVPLGGGGKVFAQRALVYGKITDAVKGEALEFADVYLKENTKIVTQADKSGEYRLQVPVNQAFTMVVRIVGYKEANVKISPMTANEKRQIDVALAANDALTEVVIKEKRIEDGGMVKQKVEILKVLPTASGNFESVLPAIALGTSSGTGGELSSQYNVRGGNYDENLVYVNDFEIYRPQLVRAGQQEGLTFPNIDLIRDLSFSSGGFDAKYGDKLSSVLDIKYKRPDSLRSSIGASLLGGSAHLEGSVKLDNTGYRRFRYLAGARYKTTQYLLNSLDVKGEYTPTFGDVQTFLTYDLSRDWQVAAMANYNTSKYNLIPYSGERAFGLINYTLKLSTDYEGKERDDFTTAMGGVSLTYIPDRKHNPLYLKFLASSYQSRENERFDIIGNYSLGEVQSNLGSDKFGEVVAELGSGIQQQWVRNYLTSNVSNVEHKGGIEFTSRNDTKVVSNFIQWSIKGQHESIYDRLNEWERLDSALYSLNYDTTRLLVAKKLKTTNSLESNRLTGYLQNTFTLRRPDAYELQATVGARIAYWDLNNEAFFTPRAQLLIKPLSWKRDASLRLSWGHYYQSPFYRELRDLEGVVHKDLQSQKSQHFVVGYSQDFFLGRNPKKFRFITEAYYKQMWDLVSFDIDNVRIRYSGKNDSKGYATGLDLRLNGEFVPGAESWFNLSFLRTRESINGITHRVRELGDTASIIVSDVPRPSDRLWNASIFFQDYLRTNKNFKMHLNFTVGSGLPFGIPNNNIVFRNTYRYNPYHRVDIGFSYLLFDKSMLERRPNHLLRFTRSSWVSVEVFNLMNVYNQASKTWIKTIFRQQYAVPNYLTLRRINVRLKVDF